MLTKLNFQYADAVEEQEYTEAKTPLVRDFFKYLFLALTIVLILYAVRYFVNGVDPQNYLCVALIVLGGVLFMIKSTFGKYMECLLLVYLLLIIGVLISAFRQIIYASGAGSRESFYMGYAFGMIHRLIGFNVVKFKYSMWLYVFSLIIKFPVISNPDSTLIVIVIILDLLTIALSFKSERLERGLFDVLYKTKKDIIKFKQLLTQYLPNQMAIFSSETCSAHYMNNAFKRTFKCPNVNQVKGALEKLTIEKDTIEKSKLLFTHLGFNFDNIEQGLSLANFMQLLCLNSDMLRDFGTISIPVIEDDVRNESIQVIERLPKENAKDLKAGRENSHTRGNSRTTQEPSKEQRGLMDSKKESGHDQNESHRSSDRGSSRSVSSDVVDYEGRKRVFKVKIFPLLWDNTEAIAMVLDDITQQRIIMELKVADKNKDLVIAMVSHELRTPLNGMLGLIDIAKKNITQPETLSYLKACKNSGMLLLNLVNSILDLYQIKNKTLKLVNTKINIADMLTEVKSLFSYFCVIKKLYLNVEISPSVPSTIYTDKGRLSQIIVNLVGNAFKFTFSGGVTVRVDLESLEPLKLKFSIEDTGIGIKKEDQEKLFKMYGKLEQQDKKINTQGVGLGLTISNTLAMLLDPSGGAGIHLESEADKGSCFSFVVQSIDAEASQKDADTVSIANFSSVAHHEEKDASVLQKMAVYTINNNENFTKMTASSQNIDSRRFISPVIEPRKFDGHPLMTNIGSGSISSSNSLGNPLLKGLRTTLNEIDEIIMRPPSPRQMEPKYEEIEEDEREYRDEDREHGKPWCLVVDDNPFNLMVACHIMEERNYQVKTALNGKEAIERAMEHHAEHRMFKVMLMDCQMPVMDGYQATRILKTKMKAGELTDCPIIALTANNRNDEHDKLCGEVGMSGHVAKPLQIDELELVLRQQVQKLKK